MSKSTGCDVGHGFSTPVIESTVSGPACDACWTAASPINKRPDVLDCVFSDMCVDHATGGVLYDSTSTLEN